MVSIRWHLGAVDIGLIQNGGPSYGKHRAAGSTIQTSYHKSHRSSGLSLKSLTRLPTSWISKMPKIMAQYPRIREYRQYKVHYFWAMLPAVCFGILGSHFGHLEVQAGPITLTLRRPGLGPGFPFAFPKAPCSCIVYPKAQK